MLEKTHRAWRLCNESTDGRCGTLRSNLMLEYQRLVEEWNDTLSLMSARDAKSRFDEHVADSVSLIPYVKEEGSLLDIGSGGGLPAIPLAICLKDIHFVLIERNQRKFVFLQRVVNTLMLNNCELIHGSFPADLRVLDIATVTARAVEKPSKVHDSIASFLAPGTNFLCQGEAPSSIFSTDWFHVELVSDEFSAAGLRRGMLTIVRKK